MLVLAGCGFGEDRSAGSGKITEEQLARMVLPLEELGPVARGFRLDGSSGPLGNRDAAKDSIDPKDSAVSLVEKGRVTGYTLSYVHPKLASLERTEGVDGVETTVELFRDEIYAAGYLDKQVGDFQRFEGTGLGPVRLNAVSEFAVPGVGDEGRGVRGMLRLAGIRFWTTTAGFRRGRIVASVTIVRADRANAAAEARALAAALDVRIQAVLGGRLGGEPVELAPSSDGLKLKALTLRLADLPAGASVSDAGSEKRDSRFREFDVGGVPIGGSRFDSLRSEAEILEDEVPAALALRALASAEGRRLVARTVTRQFRRRQGVELEQMRVRLLPARGRDTVGMALSFRAGGTQFRLAMVVVRAGPALGTLVAVATSAGADPAGVLTLAGKARARLRAGT